MSSREAILGSASERPGPAQSARECVKQKSRRVCLLTNIIPPYLRPVFLRLTERFPELRILVSAPAEPNRPWAPQWNGLKVRLQKSLSFRAERKHPHGFAQTSARHFPYDTIPSLFRLRPDVVVSTELGLRTVQAVSYRWLFPSSRLVLWVDLSEHTEKGLSRARTATRRFLLSKADAVIATGDSCRRYLLTLGVSSSQIVEVPFAADAGSFWSVPLSRNSRTERRMLYVGQLIERKGLQRFLGDLSAWAQRHPRRSLELWFVGDGPLRSALERTKTPANLAFTFFGNVAYETLPAFYSQAGICVLPTLADTWALVVNEALAAGVPILGSLYSQGVEQLVRDGENGWTFFPDKPGDTQRALDRALLAPDQLLSRMRGAARASTAWLTPEYSADKLASAISLALSTFPTGRKRATASKTLEPER